MKKYKGIPVNNLFQVYFKYNVHMYYDETL